MKKFKCNYCSILFEEPDIEEGMLCPICKYKVMAACNEDKICDCIQEITGGIQVCPVCHEFTCPCGSHDVSVISRVTGYLAEVGGWGAGKRAEFADRTRYDETTGGVINNYIK